jgi:hypothetical protein
VAKLVRSNREQAHPRAGAHVGVIKLPLFFVVEVGISSSPGSGEEGVGEDLAFSVERVAIAVVTAERFKIPEKGALDYGYEDVCWFCENSKPHSCFRLYRSLWVKFKG